MKDATLDPCVRDSPVYWFTLLEAARRYGDYSTAAEADRELRRLGVQVSHRRKRPPGRDAEEM
jgi:hypothetical protein